MARSLAAGRAVLLQGLHGCPRASLSLLSGALRGMLLLLLLLLPSQWLPPSSLPVQVLGEAMAGISQSAKNSRLAEFGESISTASKALCGFTEAAAQVRRVRGATSAPLGVGG